MIPGPAEGWPWVAAIARALLLLGVAIALGTLLHDEGLPSDRAAFPRRRLMTFALVAIAGGTVLGVGHVLWQFDDGDVRQVLATAWGALAAPGGMGLVVRWRTGVVALLAGWYVLAGRRLGRPGAVAAGCALAVGLTLDGHAMDAGTGLTAWPPLTRSAFDVLHGLSAGTWLGGLLLLVWRLGRVTDGARLVKAFSGFAVIAFVLALTTGVGLAWVELPKGGIPAWLALPYGKVLIAKLVAVAGVSATAAHLRWRHVPVLVGEGTPAGLRRAVAIEAVLGTAILLATALLTQLADTPAS